MITAIVYNRHSGARKKKKLFDALPQGTFKYTDLQQQTGRKSFVVNRNWQFLATAVTVILLIRCGGVQGCDKVENFFLVNIMKNNYIVSPIFLCSVETFFKICSFVFHRRKKVVNDDRIYVTLN